jgi:hypothetical protein
MKDILINQYDEVEVRLVQLYDYIKSEMASAGTSNADYEMLLEQRQTVKDLLWNVRATLRDLAPELYPEF